MKIFALVSYCFLAVAGVCAEASQLLYQKVIEGLDAYASLTPVNTSAGEYHGMIGVNTANDRVDIYDSSGARTNQLELADNLYTAIGRSSDNGDTLVIYALAETPWVGYNPYDYDVFHITMITVAGSDISMETVTPHCFSTYGTENPDIRRARLEFAYSDTYQPTGLIFHVSMNISVVEMTMGITTISVPTFMTYTLNLSGFSVRENAYDYAAGSFGGPDTCHDYTIYSNYYHSVMDDPWNSYTSNGTTFSISSCGAQLAAISSPGAWSYYLATDNFIPATPNDEVIYWGTCQDPLGVRQEIQDHWACYSVASDTVSEEWWISSPPGFVPFTYLSHRNAIIGITGQSSVDLFDCESGSFVQSYPFQKSMEDECFLLTSSRDVPSLFGRVGDTVFVYDVQEPTDVDSGESGSLPTSFALFQNYPNPFNPSTTIAYNLPRRSHVTIEIFNVLGENVRTLVDGDKPSGSYALVWNGTDDRGGQVSTGVYLYRLRAGDHIETRKMLLLK